jgi:Family of unknown function (DUF6527)
VRLADLDPRWVVDADIVIGGVSRHYEGRTGMGITFACPHCVAQLSPEVQALVAITEAELPREAAITFLGVWFANPIDGGPATDDAEYRWHREGATFDTLTLSPSIDASKSGHWHGFITNGEIR